MNENAINAFVASLDQFGRNYVNQLLSFSRQVMDMIAEFDIPKEEFCKWVEISESEYEQFLNGGRNYDLRDISKVQALHFHLAKQKKEIEAEKESEKISFPPYKYSK